MSGVGEGVLVVSGAARGIGASIARSAGAEGYRVVGFDLDGDGLRASLTPLGDVALAVEVDVASADSVERGLDAAETFYSAIAGITAPTGSLFLYSISKRYATVFAIWF